MRTLQGNIPGYMIVMILSMGAFGVMGGALVAPALPTIGRAFEVPEGQQGFILSVYTLAAALSLPFIGYLIDVIGRRRVALACLLIDGAAGVSIIFAPSFGVVLILRFIQGIGIAGLIPVAMTIIGDLFSGEKRLQIMGYLTGIISLGAAVIPTLGGALASFDWRFVFAVYGLGFVFALFFLFTLPETSPFHFNAGSSSDNNNNQGDKTNQNTAHKSPIEYINSLFTVFKNKSIRNIMFQPLMNYFFLYALVTFFPIFLVTVHGFAEIFNGLALSMQGLFSAIIASRADLAARFMTWWQRISIGFILKGIAFLLMPLWPTGSFLLSISIIIYGVGFGIVSPTIYNRATKLPPQDLIGSVVAIFNTMRFLGMTLSPFLLGIILGFTTLNVVFLIVGVVSIMWGTFSMSQKMIA
ncbi:MFS transporter [Natranaerobius thermophilus]|uniref:Major facilitator superfamily MFS_1 n=1 Tax=Natranaerobius thermophilus (strain ATCC BAA-1301 / DSM 18059 / JW/NM-WN-LF) TaxID=457570 RepID=B2A785_NATTJ|nr:MFS transporter [Natranaerobius thermophilus]ACB84279.1 major facilitator superfamily MFS_1 [Natranaerobius thermophilus JW/NM-WN-LF]